MSKWRQRNEFSNYRLWLNFTDHCSAMSQRAIIPKFANTVPALLVRELITKDHSLFDPWGDGGRWDVLVKTFLEGNKDQLLVLPKIWGPVQVIPKCSDWTQGAVTFEWLIQSGGQGWYDHWSRVVTSCPETGATGSQLWLLEVVSWSPSDYWVTTL